MLQNGEVLPELEVPAVGGGRLLLPAALAGSWGVVLLYRGSWCPYCNAQLGRFARASKTFAELDIKVAALSVDDEETSAALAEKRRLEFPVGHSADAAKVSALVGAYTNDDPPYLQPTGFVLTPEGAVVTAVYSSGAIGRLVADDVAGLVRHIQAQS
ncbi:peroxiredoxin [Actinomycetospora sp. NBRC 106375]|uniref:peroxiredoxin family protein n=1 Tax=Actinomycetospora sp. NBRC 106375 TaxID=3032207 RepID=UPI0024A27A99|nr:peroxiredoxin family protein [Actinomycetospora sp. NBRC 106375]GLZ48898.1 peroxiredoxin [Actinomycetospora sp. NBRC 106375]